MNKIFNQISLRIFFIEVIPSLLLSLMIAEFFFKFGSFTLECLSFLGTWYLVGAAFNRLNRVLIQYKGRRKY